MANAGIRTISVAEAATVRFAVPRLCDNALFCYTTQPFVRRYRPMMEAFLGSRYPQVDADDAIQETLVALVDKLKTFVYDRDGNRHFHNYLCGILKFKALGLIKREVAENGRRKRLQAGSITPENYIPEKDTRWVQSAYEVALAVLSVVSVVTLLGAKVDREQRLLAVIEQAEQVAAIKAAKVLRREQDDSVCDFRLMLTRERRTWREEVGQRRGPKETGRTIPIMLPNLRRGSNMQTYIREADRVKLDEETDRLYVQILADAEAGKCNCPQKADYPTLRH